MSAGCRYCLGSTTQDGAPHAACVRRVFGTSAQPRIDLHLAKFHTAALAMVGHTTLSGAQRKLSVGLSADRMTLQVAVSGGRYILKPQSTVFPHLPENEHLSMLMAKKMGIDVPPLALVALADGSLAYVVKRFDRLKTAGQDQRKLRVEDFCQLADKPPKHRYDGSSELCARLIRRYATEPIVDSLRLFRQLLLCWCIGNGDLHLKNLSLLTDVQGVHRLSPAYDLVSTRLVLPGDRLALPLGGKQDRLVLADWRAFGAYSGLRPAVIARELARWPKQLGELLALVARSYLPPDLQASYAAGLSARVASLAQ